MIDSARQSATKTISGLTRQRTYNEVVQFIDQCWLLPQPSFERMKKLDQAFGSPSEKLSAIFVGGANGKSLTIHFASRLLREEGLKVGAFFSPHILTYNERFTINSESMANKSFTEIANEVINTAESNGIQAHAMELLTMMAVLYFSQENVDVVLFECDASYAEHPATVCNAKVVSITRATPEETTLDETAAHTIISQIMSIVKAGAVVVSGDQNKASLNFMQELTLAHGARWAMPMRKLAPLSYPFEQLHGRCATLAERISSMFLESYGGDTMTVVNDSLLIKQKGRRGRPTAQAKREAELNPKRTIEQFWKETVNELPGRFQLLDKEKPSILLDNASNLDAFTNVLLGVRLLHYQRPLKGLAIIVAAAENTLASEDFLKLVRHFFKKTSGQIILCPLENQVPGCNELASWNAENIANDLKSMKVKARACASFDEAFEIAKKAVDERNGLVVVTGSTSVINTYWHHKGIKKLA